MRQPVPSFLPLFRSEIQLRLLGLLVLDPRRTWTVNELAAATRAPRQSVHRELERAVEAGLITRDRAARPHRFRAATRSPLYRPTRSLLELTVGVESQLRRAFEGEKGVDFAVIHGSWARGQAAGDSDVDVLVVGEPDVTRVRRLARDVGRAIGRRVDAVVFTREEFGKRRARGDGFLGKALGEPHIVIAGSVDGA
jgi:predicted nucleotidyltransferase